MRRNNDHAVLIVIMAMAAIPLILLMQAAITQWRETGSLPPLISPTSTPAPTLEAHPAGGAQDDDDDDLGLGINPATGRLMLDLGGLGVDLSTGKTGFSLSP